MRRLKFTVAYAGRNYCGWQRQKNGVSVQEVIEQALRSIVNEPVFIVGAGRTDAGVNAEGQVFHFDTAYDLPLRKWKSAVNAHLPEDIHIKDVEEKNELFHARYCVKQKQYDYRIRLGEYDLFTRDTAYQCPYELDIECMKDAARIFTGTHDFSSFCSNSYAETPDQVRTVDDIRFREEGGILTISYTGAGFLRYMVRMMTGALLECGRGRMESGQIREMLEHPDKRTARKNAVPQGLTLMRTEYFEVLALNRDSMIREILPGDNLTPAGNGDAVYAFTEKKTQRMLGSVRISGNHALWTVGSGNMHCAEELYPVLQQYHPELDILIENEH